MSSGIVDLFDSFSHRCSATIVRLFCARIHVFAFTLNQPKTKKKKHDRALRRNLNSIYIWHTHTHTKSTFLCILNHFLCVFAFSIFSFDFASSFFLLSLCLLFTLAHLCMRLCACVLVLAWKAAHVCEFESFVCSARTTHFISIRSLCATGSFLFKFLFFLIHVPLYVFILFFDLVHLSVETKRKY